MGFEQENVGEVQGLVVVRTGIGAGAGSPVPLVMVEVDGLVWGVTLPIHVGW